MAKIGKFISKNFMNKKLEVFIGLDNEWLSYADGDVQSYTIIIATPVAYDEESGTMTLKNNTNQTFYLNEESIEMFWEIDSGFKLLENVSSTIRHGKRWLKNNKPDRDIM